MQNIENYTKEKRTIDLGKANVFSILILFPILLIFGLPFYLIWGESFSIKSILDGLVPMDIPIMMLYFFGITIIGIILHELIHGIFWAMFTKNGFKSIKFGVLWKMLTPYCHCTEPLKVKQYIIGAIAPAVILGFIPSILALFNGSLGLLIFGMFFTMAAAGDFLIINLIRKENKNSLVQDHPTEAGYYIYKKN